MDKLIADRIRTNLAKISHFPLTEGTCRSGIKN